jgi:penicillin-binding protein 1A
MIKKIIFLLGGLIVAIVSIGVATLYWLVALNPGEQIRQGNIEAILSMESPVFYRDGRDKVGVFFEEAHRQYISYEQIPADFVNALIAAEDQSFFRHGGVDYQGILRALIANVRAGRVVQGGSTLTQQTAKNLFKRHDRSLRSKLQELLYAWRLEYHYPKEKILEFYANQFFVSGNGRGLGVAARYYFDKSVEELDILEAAFIAGSVKSPTHYNPFIKRTEESASRARDLARQRTSYVFRQMHRLGLIDPQSYQQHLEREIPFKQGRMQFVQNTILDLVRDALGEPQVIEAFQNHGIDNFATSGIRVYTTVEKELQQQAEHALRKELSQLDVRLRGYDREELQKKYAPLVERSRGRAEPGTFLFGRIAEVRGGAEPSVQVILNPREGASELHGGHGWIDEAGLMGLLDPLLKYEKNQWAEAKRSDLPLLLARLQTDDLVYVHLREHDPLSGEFRLDLEKYPELQGGILALKDGTIRAMVGGLENHFYNRAVTAKRPMGSAIKPLVYAAALQLGWSSTDLLNNERAMFVYQREAYFPRPIQPSPHRKVSMNWAGVLSENVASVWLLYHLCDKLAPAQFREVAARMGLARLPEETYNQYRHRIRDIHGVSVDRNLLYRTAFSKAVERIGPDLIFDGRIKEYDELQTFHFLAGLQESTEDEILEPGRERTAEDNLRLQLLERSFERFLLLRQEVTILREKLERDELTGPARIFQNRNLQTFAYAEKSPGGEWEPVGLQELQFYLEGQEFGAPRFLWNEVLIDGILSVATIDLLTETTEQEFLKLSALPAYSDEVLYQLREFRVLVSLHYLIGLSRELGVKSNLQPVLSFPLGSNVISLLELARLYEGLVTGTSHHYESSEESDGFAIIDRVETSDGKVIFIPERRAEQVIGPEAALAVSNILHNAVLHGTGRYAGRHVRLHSPDPEIQKQLRELGLGLPLLGKTGTSNRFTNSSFAGYVPGREQGGNGVVLTDGYVLATYVGFDDNRPMVRTTTRITGATGALPVWTRVANAIVQRENYAENLDLIDFYFDGQSQLPFRYPDLGQAELGIDPRRGGIPIEGAERVRAGQATILTFGQKLANGQWQPARIFNPYWRVMEKGS